MEHQNNLISEDIEKYLSRHENKTLLRFITCGSVDDGKSTLIGRLLHDSKMIFEDQMESIVRDSKKSGSNNGEIDLALLVDGLQSEREQGITIDVAYRYFSTDKRKFIIADTPGHEQYTRNMATGASTADLAVILIDASRGVLTQTKRHSYIVKLLGIKQVIIAVNKMDTVNYSEDVFKQIKADYSSFANELGLNNIEFLPISALKGDNVVNVSTNMFWYEGESLISMLDNIDINMDYNYSAFNFPVQYVNRPDRDFRGYSGTVVSGFLDCGDDIKVFPSGKSSRVKSIVTYDGNLNQISEGMAVTLTLDDEIDISRGDVITKSNEQVKISKSFDVNIVWMNDEALSLGKNYTIKRAATVTTGVFENIHYKTDINSLEKMEASSLSLNEIGLASLNLSEPIVYVSYEQNRKMGSFIIIDRLTNNTVGVGMIACESVSQSTGQSTESVSEYSDFEVEFNALIRKHFPGWESKAILNNN